MFGEEVRMFCSEWSPDDAKPALRGEVGRHGDEKNRDRKRRLGEGTGHVFRRPACAA